MKSLVTLPKDVAFQFIVRTVLTYNIKEELAQRLIEVEWEDTEHSRKEYAADLEIYGYDRSGLLSDVLQVISSMTKI